MNRHTEEMLHDPTTHHEIRYMEFVLVLGVAIVALYGILYHWPF